MPRGGVSTHQEGTVTSHEDTRGGVVQLLERDARVLDGLVSRLEHTALLDLHVLGHLAC